jgi:hyperosmotically inducible periplasmic protein
MRREHWGVVAVVCGLLLVSWTSVAQEPKGTKERIKDKVRGAVTTLKKGVAGAEESMKAQYARARDAVHNMGVEGRVYGRLHWDKALQGAKIDLHARKEGVIVLSGTVADARAKAKALELTNDTVGVVEVVDELKLASASASPSRP